MPWSVDQPRQEQESENHKGVWRREGGRDGREERRDGGLAGRGEREGKGDLFLLYLGLFNEFLLFLLGALVRQLCGRGQNGDAQLA